MADKQQTPEAAFELKKLVVEKNTNGTRCIKREGGGPSIDLTSEEWRLIKTGYYD